MTDAIRANSPTGPVGKPSSAAPKTDVSAAPSLGKDQLLRSPLTAAQVDTLQQAVAALEGLPPVPAGVAAKREWLQTHGPTLESAKQAASALGTSAFFHKVPEQTVADAAGARVRKAEAKFQEVEEEAGLREPVAPASPFRPLFGYSQGVKGLMGSGPLGAVVGLLVLLPAVVLDIADMVTRPLQALAFPVFWGKHKVDQLQYEAAKRADDKQH